MDYPSYASGSAGPSSSLAAATTGAVNPYPYLDSINPSTTSSPATYPPVPSPSPLAASADDPGKSYVPPRDGYRASGVDHPSVSVGLSVGASTNAGASVSATATSTLEVLMRKYDVGPDALTKEELNELIMALRSSRLKQDSTVSFLSFSQLFSLFPASQ